MTRALCLVAAFLVTLVASVGNAGPAEDQAREQVRQAATAYNLGHYDEAARHYEEAYRLVQDPVLLYNIGQSYRLGEKPEKAITAYRSYLRTADADAPHRKVVEKHVAELKRQLDESKSSPSEVALVPAPAAAPAPLAPATTPQPSAAPEAPPAPVAPAAAEPLAAVPLPEASVPADQSLSAMAVPAATPASTPFYKKWWFWTGVGAAVVAGTVTAVALSRGDKNGCSGESLVCVGIK